jgi:ABC-type transport system involved in multi-copper enzyme maturation permease subunit
MKATVQVVTAPQVEEVSVFVRFHYPEWLTILSFAVLLARIGFVVWVTILYSFVGFILAIWFGTWIPSLVARPLISRFSAAVKGSLVFQDQVVMLSVPAGPYFPTFSALEWQSSKQFVFKMGLKKVEIQFTSDDEAAKAVRLIRSRFP